MTKHPHFSRPAIAAIVAVLALSTAPAMAQPASDEPVVEPSLPPVAAEPAPAPEVVTPAEPAQVQIAPPTEVVQSVPASQPEAVTPAAPAGRAPVQTRSAPVVATPAQASTTREVLTRPTATPVVTPAAEPGIDVAAAQSAPLTQPSVADGHVDNAAWWALGAGGLLFVGGLGAMALNRGRRQPALAHARRTATARKTVDVQPAVAAEAAIAVPEPVLVNTTAKTTHRRAKAHSDWPELEEMVAEAPSPENPFLTRSKRMRRAKFLVEHGDPQPLTQPATHAAKEAKQEVKSKTAPKTANSKSSPTYSFGGKATARANWKPATT
jgi:hypothetical protein